jgi:hypothetical protein
MYMDESWRISIKFHDQLHTMRKSSAKKVIRDLRSHLGGIRVVRGKTDVLLYADTAEGAEEAQRVAQEVLARHNSAAVVQLEHWDVASEAWQAPSARSSSASSEQRAAHERRQRQEREQSMATGQAAWQVRVDLPSHRDVSSLSEHLKSEGWPVVQRRKHLIAGANCEDEAAALAHEIERYCGADAVIRLERSVFGWISPDSIFTPGASG